MDALIIETTENTPKIHFDPANFSFEISGESRPEDVRKFYEPVLDWLDQFNAYLYWLTDKFVDGEKKAVEYKFVFEYFNSSSAKYIMDIMAKLAEIQANCPNSKISVCWTYDELDEDMLEAGQEFENITNIPFRYIVKKD